MAVTTLAPAISTHLPALIAAAGERASCCIPEFVRANICNTTRCRRRLRSRRFARPRPRQNPRRRGRRARYASGRSSWQARRARSAPSGRDELWRRGKISAPTVVAIIASEAKQSRAAGPRPLDCFVASLLAMMVVGYLERFRKFAASPVKGTSIRGALSRCKMRSGSYVFDMNRPPVATRVMYVIISLPYVEKVVRA